MSVDSPLHFQCPAEDIAAYLDGELSAEAEVALEVHIAECESCRASLNDQKQLLLMIDGSLERTVEPPAVFVRHIIANAESRVRGLRDLKQVVPVLLVIVGLTLFGLLLMPVRDLIEASEPLRETVSHVPALIRMVAGTISDVLFGISVFIRPSTLSTVSLLALPVIFCIFIVALIVSWKLKTVSVRNDTK